MKRNGSASRLINSFEKLGRPVKYYNLLLK